MSEHMRKARAAVPGLSEALRSIDDVERSSDTPDAQEPQVRCNNCGAALPARKKLKSFCNYACRGQFQVVKATGHRTGLIGSKNTKQVRALQSLKRRSIGAFALLIASMAATNSARVGSWILAGPPMLAANRSRVSATAQVSLCRSMR